MPALVVFQKIAAFSPSGMPAPTQALRFEAALAVGVGTRRPPGRGGGVVKALTPWKAYFYDISFVALFGCGGPHRGRDRGLWIRGTGVECLMGKSSKEVRIATLDEAHVKYICK
ncbi:MAG TPA: hypothetical protein PLG75_02085 [Methanoculleus sp.]|nr:hypothetical protein [Methanoculleus sp.]